MLKYLLFQKICYEESIREVSKACQTTRRASVWSNHIALVLRILWVCNIERSMLASLKYLGDLPTAPFSIQLGSFLHDVAHWKFKRSDEPLEGMSSVLCDP